MYKAMVNFTRTNKTKEVGNFNTRKEAISFLKENYDKEIWWIEKDLTNDKEVL